MPNYITIHVHMQSRAESNGQQNIDITNELWLA